MSRCLRKVVLYHFFFLVIAICRVYASPDSLSLPSSLIQKLAALKQEDDLEYWIYERLMYVEKDPFVRVSFLMRTQQEAWRTYKTYDERLAWFDLLSSQGYCQLQTGNIVASINAYETALSFYESYPLPDADIIETVLKPLGNNYTRLADYNTALFIHQKTMSLALKKKNDNLIASTYSNMAICASSQSNLTAASQYCSEGIKYASHQTSLYGLLLSTLADILSAQNRFDTAAVVCNQSLKKLQQYKNEDAALYWYTSALQVAAKIAMKQQKYLQAAGYAQQALQIFNKHFPVSRQREKAKVHVLLGDIYNQNNKAGQSLAFYQQALIILIPGFKPADINQVPAENLLYSENTLTDALCGKATALQQLHQPQQALEHYITAFNAEAKRRREFFYAESKLQELQESRSRVEAAIKLAYSLWTASNNKKYLDELLLITEMSRAQVLMDERRSKMEAAGVAATDSLFRKTKQLQQAIIYYQHELVTASDKKNISTLLQQTEYELSLLQKQMKQQANILTTQKLHSMFSVIPAHVTMLEFFAGRDSSFIIELDNRGIQSVYIINQSDTLHKGIAAFMHHWFANGPSAMMNEPRGFYNECFGIYQALFKNRVWKKERHYILLPDGMFNYLPFDALLTGPGYRNDFKEWPYLFKQATLSQAYSLATWVQQQSTRYSLSTFTGFFVSKGKDASQVALAIQDEYEALQKKISGRFYTNTQATWNVFNTTTDSTGILHISTHAVSSASDSFPYLQLYDKPFYLFDLRYKHFAPALVVLSACKTADGLLLEGEGLNSISRGFAAAGAGGVISGLWNVNDKTAIALLQLFYSQLQQQGDVAIALHNAKQKWLQDKQENAMLYLPYYWAGFIYSGHLQPVQVPVIKSYKLYYWLPALVILAGFLYFLLRKKRLP